MPEIAEVHRVVHFIRQHLVGKRIATVQAQHDENVYGKVGTSGAAFEAAMKGKKIVGAGSQGKYFWMEMESPPHPVLHFGMTGWLYIRDQATNYYKPRDNEAAEWPPKFWKFQIETQPEKNKPAAAAAFADARRFGRVRLVDCPGKEIRKCSPLKENGPDPVIDTDVFTQQFLLDLCARKKIPIKALLLDQANISGIGNWVGDEVLYHARIHPEQYAHTLKTSQITQLYESIRYICNTACEALADSDKFPEEWLFKHRWGKGKKESANQLPNGAKIVFVTVGGRTSAVVPSVQKKTGPVAADVDDADEDHHSDVKGKAKKGKTAKREEEPNKEPEEDEEEPEPPVAKKRKRGATESKANGKVAQEEAEKPDRKAATKKARTNGATTKAKTATTNGTNKATSESRTAAKSKNAAKDSKTTVKAEPETGRRRSGRLSRS